MTFSKNKINNMQYEYVRLLKILLIGTSAVGKSSLLLRFTQGIFVDKFLPTLGVDFKIGNFVSNGQMLMYQIWDTAGQERFRTVTASYYKGAHGVVLVYDITDRQSFKDIENWLADVDKYGSQNIVKLLIGNKSDLQANRQVSTQQGKTLADALGLMFVQTSAKNSSKVEEAFTSLCKEIKVQVERRNARLQKKAKTDETNKYPQLKLDNENKSKCC